MHRLLEHTADIQILARGKDLPELFWEMAAALSDYMFENSETSGDALNLREVQISAKGQDHESLLVDWLSQLLYLACVEKLRLKEVNTLVIDGSKLDASAQFEPGRPARDVKAVTYHALKVERTANGVEAIVTLDI